MKKYYWIKRDSRVVTISFSWRFGKAFKAGRREEGPTEEEQRLQNG